MSRSSDTSFGGVGIGGAVAAYLSWTTWHSVGWAALHCLVGWIYVVYWCFEYSK